MSLRINDVSLTPQPVQAGWNAYEWLIPARGLHQGTNEIAIVVDRLPAEKTIAVADVRLEQRP
jgi:hypothetical protein